MHTVWLLKTSNYLAEIAQNCKRRTGTLIAKEVAEAMGMKGMKKGLISIVCLVLLSISAIPAAAQTRSRWADRRYEQQRLDSRYRDRNYRDGYNRYYDDRSVWDRHRDKITTGAGAGAGALLGSVIGGNKGAIIGAIAGGGGAALYTYKLRDRRYNYRRRY